MEGGNARSSSSTNSRLSARRRRRLDNAAAATQLLAGESSPALLLPGAQSSSSSELAGQGQNFQGHFRGGNDNAFTAAGSSTSTLVSNDVGAIGAVAEPEMESSVQGDNNSFQISREQFGPLTNMVSQQFESTRRRRFGEQAWRVRPILLLAFRAYAVRMDTFENPNSDDLNELIRAAIQVHLKPRTYRQLIVSEDEQCGICLDEYVDGEAIADLAFCMHVFHYNCIRQWLLLKNSCPFCNMRALFINPYDPFIRDY